MSTSPHGCARHLGISAILLLVLGVGMVVWNWDTFSMIVSNMTSMGEGAVLAKDIASPDDLLDVLAEREGVSLVAFDVGDEENGIYYRADAVRPVVNLPRLILLAGYAEEVKRGVLNPASRVPLDSVSQFHLTGMGHQGHTAAVDTFQAQGRIVDGRLALADVVDAMIRWNDAAAADYVLHRLPRSTVDSLAEGIAGASVDPPIPSVGRYLVWNNHTVDADPGMRIEALEVVPRRARIDSAYQLMKVVRTDTAFRRREHERLRKRGTDLTLAHQQRMAEITFPRGTARGYASLMAQLVSMNASSPVADSLMRTHLERPVNVDTLDAPFQRVATESGAFPGIMSFAGYVHRDGNAPPRVIVLLIEDLPMAVFYHLLQTGIDRGFQLQLLGDDAFFEKVRRRFQAKEGESPSGIS